MGTVEKGSPAPSAVTEETKKTQMHRQPPWGLGLILLRRWTKRHSLTAEKMASRQPTLKTATNRFLFFSFCRVLVRVRVLFFFVCLQSGGGASGEECEQ